MASRPAIASREFLTQVRHFLCSLQEGIVPSSEQEKVWKQFYEHYVQKIRTFALSCNTPANDVADCAQEVWRELLVRLPTFRLDPKRGQFDTWLFSIVRTKAADLGRRRKRPAGSNTLAALQMLPDDSPNPGSIVESRDTLTVLWSRLQKRLSRCTMQVLQLRLVEQRSVGEVAERLRLSEEQVWYRLHRARRELSKLGASFLCEVGVTQTRRVVNKEEKAEKKESAQEVHDNSVSHFVSPSSIAFAGGSRVDYVFRELELGRRELNPEWKVEWNCDGVPRPVLYLRKLAMVAFAEICGPGEFIDSHWPAIVSAAVSAGVAAGIATIIATPTAALPSFQKEFQKNLHGKVAVTGHEECSVALSAKLEPNGPWFRCDD